MVLSDGCGIYSETPVIDTAFHCTYMSIYVVIESVH